MHLDKVLHLLGDWGRYEIIFFVVMSIAGTWFPAWQIFGIIFVGDSYIAQECKLPDNTTDGEYETDGTCNVVFSNATHVKETLENCPFGVHYLPSYSDENSAVTEYGLVCERGYLAQTSQSIFFLGVLVGAYVAGQLSDIIGRKPVFLGSLIGEAIFGILTAVSWNYASFIVFWFFVGMFENGINIVMYVHLLEMFAPNKRTVAGAIDNVFWGFGVVLLAPIAYIFKGWRLFSIIVSLPCFLAIPLWFFLYESPRWLLSRDRKDDAVEVLKKIEKFNKVTLPEGALANLTATEEGESKTGEKITFLNVFLKARLLINSLVMFYAWLVNSMVYYGLSLSSSYLVGDKYLNFFFLALVEVPAYLVIWPTMMYWGRRPTMVLFLAVAGVFSIITAFIPPDRNVAVIVCAMIGKLGITASFGAAFLYGTEIFPTSIRNVGFGLSSLSGRIGGIIAPLLFILADVYPPGPLLIFGISSLLAAALSVLLPETLQRPLPETLDEANNLHKTPPIRKTEDVNDNHSKNGAPVNIKEISSNDIN